jgi:hypothetical protein
VWLSAPATQAQERELATAMCAARAAEYRTVTAEAESAVTAPAAERAKVVRRLRGELRRIGRRDFFPPADRDAAQAAVHELAACPPP